MTLCHVSYGALMADKSALVLVYNSSGDVGEWQSPT